METDLPERYINLCKKYFFSYLAILEEELERLIRSKISLKRKIYLMKLIGYSKR